MTSAPFSRPHAVSALRDKASPVAITASPVERAALAREDGLVAIKSLEADFYAKRDGRTGLKLTGEVRATITQTCVVSLEPFDAVIKTAVEARFDSAPREETEEFGLADLDPPDPIIDGKIDLGAVAAEFLALSLDPYPRRPDALFSAEAAGVAPQTVSPFAALRERLAAKAAKG